VSEMYNLRVKSKIQPFLNDLKSRNLLKIGVLIEVVIKATTNYHWGHFSKCSGIIANLRDYLISFTGD
jgi:hypothetical protein